MSLSTRKKAASLSHQSSFGPVSNMFNMSSPVPNTPSFASGMATPPIGTGEYGGMGFGAHGTGQNGMGQVGGVAAGGQGQGQGQVVEIPGNGIGTNNLAAKTAALGSTQTLYQTCSDTRRRLRMVNGYAQFLDLPRDAPRLDVVTHVWHSFRLGSSLCHLFNMLLPTFDPHAPPPIQIEFPNFDYAEGNGVLTWGSLPENQKKCKRPAAQFIMALTNLRKEGRWPESDPLWAIHELFQDDTGGLVKVLRTVGLLLDQLPTTAWTPEETFASASPMTAYGSSASLGNGGFFSEGSTAGGTSMQRHQSSQSFSQTNGSSMMRPGSSASTYHNGHMSSLSISSTGHAAYPGPRSPYGETPLIGAVPLPSARPGVGLSINTSVDLGFKSGPQSAITGIPPKAGAFDFGPIGHGEAAMQVWEIVKTEKKYVQELEILQTYSQSLIQNSIVAPDTVHEMFSNITKLVDFQRRFLTQLETEYEPVTESGPDAWTEGRWGFPFLHFERDFEVYEPYCANYMNAIEVLEREAPNLARSNLSLTVAELRPFLFSPIQRLCKYPLLLTSLVKGSSATDYRFKEELADGLDVAKRIAENVNETLRQHSNNTIVQELQWRVRDWKGHHISEFGNLLLEGRFMVTKADMDRDYEVYLFEKMILCCKEIIPDKKDKRSGKSGSILKKQGSASSPGPPKKNQLSLKGRIYVNNLTHIQQVGKNGNYALAVYWRQQDNPNEFENFVLHVNNSEQLGQWDNQITKLMKVDATRRAERDRRSQGATRRQVPLNSTFAVTPGMDYPQSGQGQNGFFPTPGTPGWDEDKVSPSTSVSSTPYSAISSRRTPSQQGIPRPPDRTSVGTSRSRSSADDPNGMLMAQWRSQQHPPIPHRQGSEMSMGTEASFGTPGGLPMRAPRGVSGPGGQLTRNFSEDMRGQRSDSFSEDAAGLEILRGDTATPNARFVAGMGLRNANGSRMDPDSTPHAPTLRNRSASSPHVYQAARMSNSETSLSPIVVGTNQQWESGHPYSLSPDVSGSGISLPQTLSRKTDSREIEPDLKRSSNGSSSTELSEGSSHSPATPYGGNSADLTGVLIGGRAGSGDSTKVYAEQVIVKVHYNRDVFKLAVPPTIRCHDLKTKVTRKVQMCGGAQSGAPIKCYYRDEDEERLRLDGDEDMAALFEPVLSGAAREVELEVRA